jgi:hypothetical protein
MESESLFIVDDSPDRRLESARQQGVPNGPVLLNKVEGAQMERERRMRMTEVPTQVKRDRIAQNKRNYRNRKRRNDSDESRQAELDAEFFYLYRHYPNSLRGNPAQGRAFMNFHVD